MVARTIENIIEEKFNSGKAIILVGARQELPVELHPGLFCYGLIRGFSDLRMRDFGVTDSQ
jgi:hypothetical protein